MSAHAREMADLTDNVASATLSEVRQTQAPTDMLDTYCHKATTNLRTVVIKETNTALDGWAGNVVGPKNKDTGCYPVIVKLDGKTMSVNMPPKNLCHSDAFGQVVGWTGPPRGNLGYKTNIADARHMQRLAQSSTQTSSKPSDCLSRSDQCWGCGAQAAPGKKFSECTKCIEKKIDPCLFCSKECFALHWPRHLQWHKQQKKFGALAKDTVPKQDGELVLQGAELAQQLGDEHLSLFTKACYLCDNEHDYKGAVKLFRKAIAIDPQHAEQYYCLGLALQRSNDLKGAAESFVIAVERYEITLDDASWARSLAFAFQHLSNRKIVTMKPSWWSDTEMLTLSKRAAKFANRQETINARLCILKMRGFALYGAGPLGSVVMKQHPEMPCYSTYDAAPRTNAQLREAAICFDLLHTLDPHHGDAAGGSVHRDWAAKCRKEAAFVEKMMAEGQGGGDTK